MRRLFVAGLFLLCAAFANAQITTIVAANILGGDGQKMGTGRSTWLPTDLNGNPLIVSMGSTPGIMLPRAATCLISQGAFTTTPTGASCTVVDTALTNSAHFCYRVTIQDTVSKWTAPVMPCVQPTGSTWSLDTQYVPASAPTGTVTAGPAGPACATGTGTCTMTVPIVLPAAPTSSLQAATKSYVDAETTRAESAETTNASAAAAAQSTANAAIPANGVSTSSGGNISGAGTASFGTVAAGATTPTAIGSAGVTFPDGTVQSTKSTSTFPVLGTIYSASSWSSLSGFTPNGTTPTVVGGNLIFNGGTGTLNASLDYNYETDLPQWSMTYTEVVPTITSTSYGVFAGLRSNVWSSSYQESMVGGVVTSSTAPGALQIQLWNGSGMGVAATSVSSLSIAAGDTLSITVSRNYDTYTVTANNLTTSSAPVSVSYQANITASFAFATSNMGRFALFNVGGTNVAISSLAISSQTPVGLDAITVGASITAGEAGGYFTGTWTGLLQSIYRVTYDAGGAEVTADALARLPEFCALKPTSVIIGGDLGHNDVLFGVSAATYEANYAAFVSGLQACGITVYHVLPLYTTAVNLAPLTAWIRATYPAANLINPDLSVFGASYVLIADGTHLTPAGHQLLSQSVLSFLQALPMRTTYTPDALIAAYSPANPPPTQPFSSFFSVPPVASVDTSPALSKDGSVTANVIYPSINWRTSATAGYTMGTMFGVPSAWSSLAYLINFMPTGYGGTLNCTYPAGTALTSLSQLTCTKYIGSNSAGQFPITSLATGTPAAGKYPDGGGAWTTLPLQLYQNGVLVGAAKYYTGYVTLSSGNATSTFANGFSFSGATYNCTSTDTTSLAVSTVTYLSANSVTVKGTGSDVIIYHCIGT